MKVGIYLTFDGNCEEAFDYYKGIFGGTEYEWKATFADAPTFNKEDIVEGHEKRILHISYNIPDSNISLMGCDRNPQMHKFKHVEGTNKQISLTPNNKDESDRIFKALSTDGKDIMPLQDMFWGSYFGYCTDKYGTRWMIDCPNQSSQSAQKRVMSDLKTAMKTATKAMEKLDGLIDEHDEPPAKKIKTDTEKKEEEKEA